MFSESHWTYFLNGLHPVFIWQQICNAFRFSRKPSTEDAVTTTIYHAAVALFALLIGLKALQVLVIVVRVFAEDYGVMPALENALERDTDNWPWWQLLLAAGLVGPLLEELAFRAHLRFSRVLFSVSLGVAVYYLLTQGVYGVRTHDLYNGFGVRVGGALFSTLACYVLLGALPVVRALESLWTRRFAWVFWIVALAFGAAHLTRYDLVLGHLPFVPLIILPQVLSSMAYGYARMRYGLVHSIAMHAFANSVPVLIGAALT